MFSINLVTLDSYQSVPTPELDIVFSHFRGAEIRQVPVIRIFGSTPRGIKTCLHVHGVFPYMYVPCMIENNVDSFMYKLATAIDSAINVSMGSAVSNNQHVYKIQKVSGIPLYGFHKTEHLFFKIYFYNPAMIKRAADLLQNGMILSHSLQPHEAHIPFILQFMMDYNLYGMSLINLKDVKHRQCMYTDSKENSQNENSLSFSNSEKYLPGSVIRQSTCKLEVDAQATDILNRQEIQNVLDINPGIAAIWNNEKCRREANGLPDVESQLLYSNTNDRVYAATDNDIYQEERLAQRLQAISQISETVTSATSSTVSYPLEVENEDNLINASCVLDHFKLSVLDEESKDEIDLNNQLLGFEKPNISKQTSLLDWSLETSILDTGDIHLVEILANLAGPNEEDKIVDDDSMLGSQYSILSNQIKEDNEDDEDDEVENLNITSFDLDSLSSWNSDTKPSTESYVPEIGNKEEEINKDTAGILENNIEDISLSSFPQYDGLNDLFLKDENHLSKKPAVNKVEKWKKTRKKLETKSKDTNKIQRYSDLLPKKTLTFQLNFNEVSNMNNKLWRILSKLDHQDLDVYDVDEVVHALSLIDYANLNKSTNQINLDKSHFKINDRTIELSIPALDGNATDSSSESELDQDITIDRQEKRICVYKSSTKSKKEANVHSSLKKRRMELENSDFGSPRKRRNICSNLLENELHYTPTKIRSIQNHSLLGKYSPLSIKILSPKAKRNLEKNSSIDEPSSSKSTCTTPKRNSNKLRMDLLHNKVCGLSSISVSSKHNQCVSISNQSESLDSEKEECNNTKNNKEVRKRLSFWDTNEKKIDCTTINIDECHSEHSSENEERKIEIPFENENDICNITYTQYLNEKLKSQLDNPNSVSVEIRSGITKDKIISITTKYNPPSRERVINTMKTYDISECKSSGPFFSNKVDLVKQKESSNKNTSINDLISFKSNLFGITGIKLWRRMKINEFYPSGANIKSRDIKRVLAGYNSIIILPLFHPPTPKHVRTWLRAKKYLLERNNKENEIRNNSDVKDTKETETNSSNSNCDKKLIECVDIEKHNSINKKFTNNKDTKAESQNCNSSKYSDGSNDTLNPSLEKMLENPLLFKNNDTQQHLGISYGQIEYTIKGHSGNVGDENFQNAKGLTVHQYLTLLSVEIHVVTRGKLLPDPEHDSIGAIFYAIHNDTPLSTHTEQIKHGAVVVNCSIPNSKVKSIYSTSTTCPTSYVASEEDLLNSLITLIRYCDPDILVGWEIESLSWGYILQRASCIGFNNFIWQISRIANVAPTYKGKTSDKDNLTDTKIPGRIILDVWRIMRHEIPLLDYTFENIMYNVLRERISCPPFQTLTEWWKHRNISIWWRVITHYITRVIGTLRILIHRDIIGRTCEHARLFGIQFYEVFSRGSQFRVESMMLRLAKPLNYIPVSPSIQQRANMRAPGSLPLIMEPESVFYTDPLIVLDFQSLYPSIIIAYNYCFSTCLGRVEHIGHHEPFEFGATTLRVKKSTAQKLQGKINFSPCGVAFVKPEIRLGILPRMLTEILNTRLMVKESMKIHGNENSVLQRILYSQQLGLKLIANVTYGYTAANFSGRMPCIEIGDSVVSKGRETLERAIKIVESTPKWGAQVVYGDTDSLFILLPGKSRKDAFIIGAEIADTVTAANPPPVKLKFEKILQPAILQTKKRYCGYMYEFPEQTEPKYLAKGIETVRRDGCPAVAKILEKSLKILFDTKDLSLLKLYVTRQFDKILCRKISIEDLTFAKEFRGLRGYKTNACVPALELTRRLIRKDPRAIPRTGERVRYVIVAGAPNQPLIHCVRTPMEVIVDEGLNPNSVYYITKVIIPPLNRCLNLIGVDVNTWYKEMSHRQISDKAVNLFTDNQKLTIRQFFSSVTCASCGDKTQKDICANCMVHSSQTVTILHEKIRWLERAHSELTAICQSCTGYLENVKCESLNCPVLYRLSQARRDLIQIPYLNNIICDGDIEGRNTI